jgi:hypothetical protein
MDSNRHIRVPLCWPMTDARTHCSNCDPAFCARIHQSIALAFILALIAVLGLVVFLGWRYGQFRDKWALQSLWQQHTATSATTMRRCARQNMSFGQIQLPAQRTKQLYSSMQLLSERLTCSPLTVCPSLFLIGHIARCCLLLIFESPIKTGTLKCLQTSVRDIESIYFSQCLVSAWLDPFLANETFFLAREDRLRSQKAQGMLVH